MIEPLGLSIEPAQFPNRIVRLQAKVRHLMVAEYLKQHPALIPPFLELKVRYIDVLRAAMDKARKRKGA